MSELGMFERKIPDSLWKTTTGSNHIENSQAHYESCFEMAVFSISGVTWFAISVLFVCPLRVARLSLVWA